MTSPIARLVAFSCRHARAVVAATLVAVLAAGLYAGARFSIHTEMAALIPADVPWRVQTHALQQAFISQGDDIAVVVEGKTPELARDAAQRLTAALGPRTDLFRLVEQPGAGPFFQREGALFLSEAEVRDLCDALIAGQPLLASAAADPSLRGVLNSLATAAEAVAAGQAGAERIARPLTAIADAAEAVDQGRPTFFAWRPLLTGRPADPADARQIVELYPEPDHTGTDPGAKGMAAVREAAARLKLDPAHGVTLRLTGEVPMEADELATLKEATGPLALGGLGVVLLILFAAVRAPRIVGAIVATVLAGLALTAAIGLLAFGQFNLISVAFLPLFVGLGIDFAIQFAVRYAAEATAEPDIPIALTRAGSGAGRGLALAAAATGVSFLAFLPTRYKGVSELGLVAGVGMGVALLLAVTFLPALIALARARSPAAESGFKALAHADAKVQAHRRAILAAAATLGLAALALSPALRFDFDPLRLRNPHTESVSTFLELARDPDTAPDTLDTLAVDIPTAHALAARLERLPQVREVYSIESFIPPDQEPKLALIRDAALLLDTTLNPFDTLPPPTDADLVASLGAAAQALRTLAESPGGAPVRAQALRLAALLQKAQSGSPALRARLQTTMVAGLPTALDEVRALLTAEPVTLDTLPADIKAQWITADGRARVQTLPVALHQDRKGIAAYVHAVTGVAPQATGTPLAIEQTQDLILGAFRQAAGLSLAAIVVLLGLSLGKTRAVALTLAPVALIALFTVGTCVLVGLDINLENLIALLLLVGIGVSFNIYFVVAWLKGERAILASSLTRAILFSALATGAGFGVLSLSQHPGTASMGALLLISLFWTLVVTLVVQPALLGAAAKGTTEDTENARKAS